MVLLFKVLNGYFRPNLCLKECYKMSFLEDLYKVASKNNGKGRIMKRCLEKELSFDDVEALAIINNQTAFTATGVERLLDIIER